MGPAFPGTWEHSWGWAVSGVPQVSWLCQVPALYTRLPEGLFKVSSKACSSDPQLGVKDLAMSKDVSVGLCY